MTPSAAQIKSPGVDAGAPRGSEDVMTLTALEVRVKFSRTASMGHDTLATVDGILESGLSFDFPQGTE
jgi:hypothetical protein